MEQLAKAPSHIVVILHSYDNKKSWYRPIKQVIEENYPDATVLLPALDMGRFSVAEPDILVAEVLKLIDAEWEKAAAQPRIIIIGHSTGSLLARKLYVVACGENENAPFEKSYPEHTAPRVWAAHVDRVILFAGLNRGWTLNDHLYTKTALLIRIGLVFGAFLQLFGITPLPFKTMRGAPFITQLRIQWLAMLRNAEKKNVGNTTIIQLLGTKDDIISPEDTVDMITGNNFIYLEVPDSDHIDVLELKKGPSAPKRRVVFENALREDPVKLREMQILPTDPNFLKVDETVTDVVFVIHGIRDTGYWTQKVARRVKAMGDRAGKRFATETSTYGYFAMLPFLLSFERKKKVEWLMDQYTENLALYPNAEFSFMGHSNGTYLLARALREYPACRFKHVVFAGSVVQSNFDWNKLILEKRIKKFYNFVASADWVVGMFPKTFQRLGLQDLGSGGFDGFTDKLEEPYQLKFVKGQHGAAIKELYWDDIAHFIVHGTFSSSSSELEATGRSRFIKLLGGLAPIPFLIIIAFILLGAWGIFQIQWDISIVLFMIFLYFLGIWKVITWL